MGLPKCAKDFIIETVKLEFRILLLVVNIKNYYDENNKRRKN